MRSRRFGEVKQHLSICIHNFVEDVRDPSQIICETCWEIRDAVTGWTITKGKLP